MNKSYNPFKMWGFWVGFIIGFILVLSITIKPFGCHPEWRSWNDDIYFGVESGFNLVGSSSCYNVVSPTYKYCAVAESDYYRYKNYNFKDCLKNPNNYPFSREDLKITIDNVDEEFLSYYGSGRVFNIDALLGIVIFALIPALIFSVIGRGIHSLIRKLRN